MKRNKEKQKFEPGVSHVRCNHCGCAFLPHLLTEKDGDIEFTFFRCDYCGKAYIVCVTDGRLREMIAEYTRLSEMNSQSRLPEPEQFRMQKLKEENAARAEELRRQYIREADDGGS